VLATRVARSGARIVLLGPSSLTSGTCILRAVSALHAVVLSETHALVGLSLRLTCLDPSLPEPAGALLPPQYRSLGCECQTTGRLSMQFGPGARLRLAATSGRPGRGVLVQSQWFVNWP